MSCAVRRTRKSRIRANFSSVKGVIDKDVLREQSGTVVYLKNFLLYMLYSEHY
jgi:hypothetical protein